MKIKSLGIKKVLLTLAMAVSCIYGMSEDATREEKAKLKNLFSFVRRPDLTPSTVILSAVGPDNVPFVYHLKLMSTPDKAYWEEVSVVLPPEDSASVRSFRSYSTGRPMSSLYNDKEADDHFVFIVALCMTQKQQGNTFTTPQECLQAIDKMRPKPSRFCNLL